MKKNEKRKKKNENDESKRDHEPMTAGEEFRPVSTGLSRHSVVSEISIIDLLIFLLSTTSVQSSVLQIRHVYYRKYTKDTSVIRVM